MDILHNRKKYVVWLLGLLLLIVGSTLPVWTKSQWFSMIVKIREAITTGDTGHLIMASASNSILYTLQNTLSFLGLYSLFALIKQKLNIKDWQFNALLLLSFIGINFSLSTFFMVTWEPVTGLLACCITLVLLKANTRVIPSLFRASILSLQIFFAFQWLNIMPSFSRYFIGSTDIPSSIKLASIYLESTYVLNFVGLAFFLPLFISAGITSILFVSFDRNISIAKENYQKEKALSAIKSKALENRIYQEIHTLTHDLKTPLVTIRGLSSLLSISKDTDKIAEYTDRMDNAVEKMSQMITSFLYGTSRQMLSIEEIINYVRAQIPIENEQLTVEFHVEEGLPTIYANKIRVVRALINIIENAMVVETIAPVKKINISVANTPKGILFIIGDNGIGITPEHLEKIWELGYSTNDTTGLGLSFAKKVIEDNSGSIEIESVVNVGTTVKVLFPLMEGQEGVCEDE